ncbi:glycine-rich protein DOT1-like [Daucus carota subsp. sativus]|uniref:glycine-rich protein DOT1-like n=1 Tax=Daucus carota subsp. sativus TaxID=79200 RepID=UPI0030832D93
MAEVEANSPTTTGYSIEASDSDTGMWLCFQAIEVRLEVTEVRREGTVEVKVDLVVIENNGGGHGGGGYGRGGRHGGGGGDDGGDSGSGAEGGGGGVGGVGGDGDGDGVVRV